MRTALLVFAILAFDPGTLQVLGEPQPLGGEFQVNSYTPERQIYPAVSVSPDGRFVIAWHSDDAYMAGRSIRGQRFAADGAKLGGEFVVNTYNTGAQAYPSVATDEDGNFVVAWGSQGIDGYGYSVQAQRFAAGGEPIGDEFQVNTFTVSDQHRPAVAMGSSGRFVVVWNSLSDIDPDTDGVLGQVYGSDGAPLGGEFQVNTYTTGWQAFPSIGIDGSGRFVVAWMSQGVDGSGFGVRAQRFGAGGGKLGSELQVNSFTVGNQGTYGPVVAVDRDGRFVVAWASYGQDGHGFGVYAQRFGAGGAAAGEEFRVNLETIGQQLNPAITAEPGGSFLITWEGPLPGLDDSLLGRLFHASGVGIGGEFQVESHTPSVPLRPVVATSGQGRLVFAWQRNGADGDSFGVQGRRFVAPAFVDDFESGDLSAWSGGSP